MFVCVYVPWYQITKVCVSYSPPQPSACVRCINKLKNACELITEQSYGIYEGASKFHDSTDNCLTATTKTMTTSAEKGSDLQQYLYPA